MFSQVDVAICAVACAVPHDIVVPAHCAWGSVHKRKYVVSADDPIVMTLPYIHVYIGWDSSTGHSTTHFVDKTQLHSCSGRIVIQIGRAVPGGGPTAKIHNQT